MSEFIDTIAKTRETVANIFARSLVSIDGLSEVEILEKITISIADSCASPFQAKKPNHFNNSYFCVKVS